MKEESRRGFTKREQHAGERKKGKSKKGKSSNSVEINPKRGFVVEKEKDKQIIQPQIKQNWPHSSSSCSRPCLLLPSTYPAA
jgi:hypothetical protein